MQLAERSQNLLPHIVLRGLLFVIDRSGAVEGICIAIGDPGCAALDVEPRTRALLGRMLDYDVADATFRRSFGQTGEERPQVDRRSGPRILYRMRWCEDGINLGGISLEYGKPDGSDDDGAEAEQRTRQRDRDVEGQGPDAQTIVQIGFL